VQAGALLGITFSFLIAAPMVKEVALALLAKGAAPLPRRKRFGGPAVRRSFSVFPVTLSVPCRRLADRRGQQFHSGNRVSDPHQSASLLPGRVRPFDDC